MNAITTGEREMIDILAGFGGLPAEQVEASERSAEAQGFYKAVRAMIDAGFRSAWADNTAAGAIVAGAASTDEIVAALAKHSNITSDYLADATASAGSEGKAGILAAEAAGYQKCCEAMAAAGFRGAWADNRLQAVGNQHGYMPRNDI